MEPTVLFKVLADETRYALLTHLLDEDYCVYELVLKVNKSQPTVSIHLKALESNGIVRSKRAGRKTIYGIADPRIRTLIETAQTVETPMVIP